MQEPPRTSPAGSTPPAARVALDEAFEAATTDDVRGLRRWLLVTGVWSVAATAIAVIALVAAGQDNDEQVAAATGQIGRVQRQLSARIDALDSRIGELARSEDVSRLESRLRAVEDRAATSSERLGALGARIDDLDRQLEQLKRSRDGPSTSDTTPSGPPPSP